VVLASNCTIAALGKSPPNFDKILEKGNQQLTLGNTKEAAAIFAEKVAKYPESGVCHLAYGKALKRIGKLSEAKAEFKSASENDPTLSDAFYELGAAQESDKEYDGALTAFQRYLELKPDEANRKGIPDRIRFCKEHM
jgi:tetratricopeptide (TPR) repeat protein